MLILWDFPQMNIEIIPNVFVSAPDAFSSFRAGITAHLFITAPSTHTSTLTNYLFSFFTINAFKLALSSAGCWSPRRSLDGLWCKKGRAVPKPTQQQ